MRYQRRLTASTVVGAAVIYAVIGSALAGCSPTPVAQTPPAQAVEQTPPRPSEAGRVAAPDSSASYEPANVRERAASDTGNHSTQSLAQESPAWYRTGKYSYNGNRCEFQARDSTRAMGFTCGLVELVLKPGLPASDVSGLVASLSGIAESTFQGPMVVIFVRVPANTERAAILRASADSRIKRAGLSLARRGVL